MADVPVRRLLTVWGITMAIIMASLGSAIIFALKAGYFTGTIRVSVENHGTYPYDEVYRPSYSSEYRFTSRTAYTLYVDGEAVGAGATDSYSHYPYSYISTEITAFREHEVWVVNDYGLESDHTTVSVEFMDHERVYLVMGNMTVLDVAVRVTTSDINESVPVELYLDDTWFGNASLRVSYNHATAYFLVTVEKGISHVLRAEYMGLTATASVNAVDWDVSVNMDIP